MGEFSGIMFLGRVLECIFQKIAQVIYRTFPIYVQLIIEHNFIYIQQCEHKFKLFNIKDTLQLLACCCAAALPRPTAGWPHVQHCRSAVGTTQLSCCCCRLPPAVHSASLRPPPLPHRSSSSLQGFVRRAGENTGTEMKSTRGAPYVCDSRAAGVLPSLGLIQRKQAMGQRCTLDGKGKRIKIRLNCLYRKAIHCFFSFFRILICIQII